MDAIATLTLILSLFIYEAYSVPPNTRYVIDDDNTFSLLLPFPIDVCFTARDNPIQYTRYVCSPDGTQLYRKVWNASFPDECNTNTNGFTTETFTTPTPCTKGDFQCDGENNYVFHNIWAASTSTCAKTASFYTLPTVVGCFCIDTTSIELSCTDAYHGNFLQYNDNSCTDIKSIGNISSCALIYTDIIGPIDLFSEIESCTINSSTINKTPSPTAVPTTALPTAITPSPITFESRFIIDNDWLFGDSYPFPIDKCLQTKPFITSLTLNTEFVYYECTSSDVVTKYKWTVSDVSGLDADFDCNKSNAQTTVITADIHNNDICNQYYFNCIGNDDYVTTFFQYSTGTDCTSASNLFPISIVTDACFCGDEQSQTSHKFQCNDNESMLYDYEGTISCVDTIDPEPTSNITGKNNECVFLKSAEISSKPYNIFGSMKECVKDNIDLFSLAPTLYPTVDTTPPSVSPTVPAIPTGSPTAQPTGNPLEPGQTVAPTKAPITSDPTVSPTTTEPTDAPTDNTQAPVKHPTTITFAPSFGPTKSPTVSPTRLVLISTDTDDGDEKAVDNSDVDVDTVVGFVVIGMIVLCGSIAMIVIWLRRKNKEKREAERGKRQVGAAQRLKSRDVDEDGSKEEKRDPDDGVDVEKAQGTAMKTERSKKRKPKRRKTKKNDDDDDEKQGVQLVTAGRTKKRSDSDSDSDSDEDDEKAQETEMKTSRRKKRKPKRRKRKKQDDDDDVLDDDEKQGVQLVTSGGPKRRSESDSDSDSDSESHDDEKKAEYVTAGGPDKDSNTDTDGTDSD